MVIMVHDRRIMETLTGIMMLIIHTVSERILTDVNMSPGEDC